MCAVAGSGCRMKPSYLAYKIKDGHTLEDISPDPPSLPLHALGVVSPLKNAQGAVKL